MPRLLAVGLVLATAGVAAGCGSGSDNDSKSDPASDGGLPPQPPTTLAAAPFRDAVTVEKGSNTHDGDVAIDRTTGHIYVTWASDKPKLKKEDYSPPQDAYVVYSDDGGKTFSDPVRANHDTGQVVLSYNNQARIVSTGENRVFATWSGWNKTRDDSTPSNVRGALSTDGGATFAQEKVVRATDGKEAYDSYQAVATYGKNVYVGFLNYTEGGGGIRMVRSSDGGKTFGKSMLAEASSCGCCDNGLAVNSKGTIFFAYRNVGRDHQEDADPRHDVDRHSGRDRRGPAQLPVAVRPSTGPELRGVLGRRQRHGSRRPPLAAGTTLVHAVAFVLGFSLVFILLGISATAVGGTFRDYGDWIARTGGVVLIAFGLVLLGAIPLAILQRDVRLLYRARGLRRFGPLGSGVVDAAFGAGWTPCIGPVLAGILALAATSGSTEEGVVLLAAYSAGLAVPFLAAAVAVDRFGVTGPRVRRWMPRINRISGALLLALGALLITGEMTRVSAWASQFAPSWMG